METSVAIDRYGHIKGAIGNDLSSLSFFCYIHGLDADKLNPLCKTTVGELLSRATENLEKLDALFKDILSEG